MKNKKYEMVEEDCGICRHLTLTIENNVIGDEVWFSGLAKTLRNYADYVDGTGGAGDFPACFKYPNGDKLTVHAGVYFTEMADMSLFRNQNGGIVKYSGWSNRMQKFVVDDGIIDLTSGWVAIVAARHTVDSTRWYGL